MGVYYVQCSVIQKCLISGFCRARLLARFDFLTHQYYPMGIEKQSCCKKTGIRNFDSHFWSEMSVLYNKLEWDFQLIKHHLLSQREN